jgi:hypothetical protein
MYAKSVRTGSTRLGFPNVVPGLRVQFVHGRKVIQYAAPAEVAPTVDKVGNDKIT